MTGHASLEPAWQIVIEPHVTHSRTRLRLKTQVAMSERNEGTEDKV